MMIIIIPICRRCRHPRTRLLRRRHKQSLRTATWTYGPVTPAAPSSTEPLVPPTARRSARRQNQKVPRPSGAPAVTVLNRSNSTFSQFSLFSCACPCPSARRERSRRRREQRQEEPQGAGLHRGGGVSVRRGEARRRGRRGDARRHQPVDPHAAGSPRPAPRGGVRVRPTRVGCQPAGAVGQDGGRLHQAPHRWQRHDNHREDKRLIKLVAVQARTRTFGD